MYLSLFHGRKHPDEEMDDWGFTGPVFGPLIYGHCTYQCDIKLQFANGQEEILWMIDDMVYYDGCYYGDWSFFHESIFLADASPDQARRVDFDPEKADRDKRPPLPTTENA